MQNVLGLCFYRTWKDIYLYIHKRIWSHSYSCQFLDFELSFPFGRCLNFLPSCLERWIIGMLSQALYVNRKWNSMPCAYWFVSLNMLETIPFFFFQRCNYMYTILSSVVLYVAKLAYNGLPCFWASSCIKNFSYLQQLHLVSEDWSGMHEVWRRCKILKSQDCREDITWKKKSLHFKTKKWDKHLEKV